ncbi:hypothetical protein CHUAL_006369 [Chamberlinius hualienensis]
MKSDTNCDKHSSSIMTSQLDRITNQKLLQRYRRNRLRLLRRKEYDRLKTMVPSIARRPKVSKVTVIEEAIKYIDHLHCALIARLKTKGLPQAFKGLGLQPKDFQHIDQSEIHELVRQVFPPNEQQQTTTSSAAITTQPSSTIERNRSVASYLSRRPRWPPRHL